MKKTVKIKATLLAAILTTAAILLTGCGDSERSKQVVVFNYGDYIDAEVIDMFEQETGYDVLYEEFVTNEAMYAKLSANAADYDVICASDYMVEKLLAEGRLLEIDYNNTPEKENIGSNYWEYSKAFDPELKYSIPYFWGVVGILYNTEEVDEKLVHSWDVLWNKDYAGEIIMSNSIRDCFVAPLKKLGYSLNTTDQQQITEAQKLLVDQKPLVQSYLVDEARDEMIAENAKVAVIYSSEAYYSMSYNDKLDFYVPDEGSNFWVDSWIIPDTCKNKEGAEAFLNFICREDIAMKNFEYVYCATPNQAVFDSLDEELQNSTAIFQSKDVLDRCEVFVSLDNETYDFYSTLWKELKAE